MRILTRPNLGGPTRQAVALWHAHRDLGIPTLLVTGSVGGGEAELSPAEGGVPRLSWSQALSLGPEAAGWVELPDLGRGVEPLADRRALRALSELLRAHAPDVVHTHTSKAGWLGRRAAWRAGVRVTAHTFHGHVLQDYFGRFASWWLRRIERRLASRTTLLFAVSPSCADELAAAGIAAADRLRVVPPAVPLPRCLDREQARRQLSIPAEQQRLVCVGRLVPIKRIEDFVATVGLCAGWHGDVVGEGPLQPALHEQAARTAAGRVHLRGALPSIAALLPAYDALVLPSVREGCPLVAVEAFAAGVPVVGYDVPGVRDVLGTWGRGLLVPPADGPAGLAAAVRRLAAETGLAAACVAESRAGVARFLPAAVAAELASAYRKALG